MKKIKGIIALDIDGTITFSKNHLENEVADFLNLLIEENWILIFVTGRTYSFAKPIWSALRGDFYCVVQNGAALYKMPEETRMKKYYLPSTLLKEIDPLFKGTKTGVLVESGKENSDICYYKPSDFDSKGLNYIELRITITPEKWHAVEHFDNLPIKDFAVGKYFADQTLAFQLAKKIRAKTALQVIVIRDPFRPGYYLAHINAKEATKGELVVALRNELDPHLTLIVAGDDFNDLEMLHKANIKIVMQNAPQDLHSLADILAPPVQEKGIITGLEKAIAIIKNRRL